MAMTSLDERLVRRDARLILLLDPTFDKSNLDPGYIKGYVPGVRENGGQYTHSAIWTVMAMAARGDNERAWELFSLINPISHGAKPADIATYRVEPYVVAADVYGVEPHTGRGGWTWYTGSAGWMYRLIVESLLGLQLDVDKLRIMPCIPASWTKFQIHYRYRETFYHITIDNDGDVAAGCRIRLDGTESSNGFIPLVDDRRDHRIEIKLGAGLAITDT
jgi:cellobiose phosphorylase